jgi:hypothetical protein
MNGRLVTLVGAVTGAGEHSLLFHSATQGALESRIYTAREIQGIASNENTAA